MRARWPFSRALQTLVTAACLFAAATGAAPASPDIPGVASRQRAEQKTFTDREIIDGFLKTAFGAEYHLAGKVDRIRKYDMPVRVFADGSHAVMFALDLVQAVTDGSQEILVCGQNDSVEIELDQRLRFGQRQCLRGNVPRLSKQVHLQPPKTSGSCQMEVNQLLRVSILWYFAACWR